MLLFGYATVVQFNDPDAPFWTVLYLFPCLLALSLTLKYVPSRTLLISGTILYGAYFFWSLIELISPGITGIFPHTGADPGMMGGARYTFANEELRETVGVFIAFGWIASVLFVKAGRNIKSGTKASGI